MSSYPIAQAKTRLSQLIEEALGGQTVIITRHGKPIVELRPVRKPRPSRPGRPSAALLDEIEAFARSLPPMNESSVDILRAMRDEE